MEPNNQTPLENNSNNNRRWMFVGITVLIIAIIVVVIVLATNNSNNNTASSQTASQTNMTQTSAVTNLAPLTSTANSSTSGGLKLTIAPVYFLSANATASSNGGATKDGNFQIQFMVNANSQAIYVHPSCQAGGTSKNGVTFQMLDNGVISNAGLGPQSCLVITNSNTKTKNGNYLIPAGGSQPFELVVVDRPATNGNYQVQISSVGYSNSDSAGTILFPLTNTGKPLETSLLAL